MNSDGSTYDHVCNFLRPHVEEALGQQHRDDDLSQWMEDIETMKSLLTGTDVDDAERDALLQELSSSLEAPAGETVRGVRVDFVTELLATSWCEVLRHAFKGKDALELRECLLPKEMAPRVEKAWRKNVDKTGLEQERAEAILASLRARRLDATIRKVAMPWGDAVVGIRDGKPMLMTERLWTGDRTESGSTADAVLEALRKNG